MDGKKSALGRFFFRHNLDKRLYRYVGCFFLLKSAYMLATEGVILASLEEELLDESKKLQDLVDKDFKDTLTTHHAT